MCESFILLHSVLQFLKVFWDIILSVFLTLSISFFDFLWWQKVLTCFLLNNIHRFFPCHLSYNIDICFHNSILKWRFYFSFADQKFRINTGLCFLLLLLTVSTVSLNLHKAQYQHALHVTKTCSYRHNTY